MGAWGIARHRERKRESRAFDADALPSVLKTERVGSRPPLSRSSALSFGSAAASFLHFHIALSVEIRTLTEIVRNFILPSKWKIRIRIRIGIVDTKSQIVSFFFFFVFLTRRVFQTIDQSDSFQLQILVTSSSAKITADKILIAAGSPHNHPARLPTFHAHWAKELNQQQRRGAAFVAL